MGIRGHFLQQQETRRNQFAAEPQRSRKMALRVGSSMLLRSLRTPKPSIVSRRAMSEMSFTFAAPNGVHYKEAAVKQIDVPSFSGSFGILPDHVPLLAVLKPGVVTVLEDDASTKKFFVSSGSITINDDSSVQILAEEAVPVEQLDANAIREGAASAAAGVSAAGADEKAKAEAEIVLETYEALQKAVE